MAGRSAARRATLSTRGRALRPCGVLVAVQGDVDRVCPYLSHVQSLLEEAEWRRLAARSLEGLAEIAAREGDSNQAVILYSAAEREREIAGVARDWDEHYRVAPIIGGLRRALGSGAFEAAWQRGQSRSPARHLRHGDLRSSG
jgi:hypothetical protein